MNSLYLGVVLGLLFIVAPGLGIWSVIVDVRASRRNAEDLSEIADALDSSLAVLRSADIGRFKAELANRLESLVDRRSRSWPQQALRMLLQTQAVALGEESRNALETDEAYRRHMLLRARRLADAVALGDSTQTLEFTSQLLALPLRNASADVLLLEGDPTIDASSRLRRAAVILNTDPIEAYGLLTEGLRVVAPYAEKPGVALALVALKWAQVAVRSPAPPPYHWPNGPRNSLKKLSVRLNRLASSLDDSDEARLAEIIYEHS